MSPSDHERESPRMLAESGSRPRSGPTRSTPAASGPEMSWLGEIVSQLEEDPGECWLALESLAAVDEEVCVAIIAELSAHRRQPGVRTLLRSPERGARSRHAVGGPLALPERSGRTVEDAVVGGTGRHPGGVADIPGTRAFPAVQRVESRRISRSPRPSGRPDRPTWSRRWTDEGEARSWSLPAGGGSTSDRRILVRRPAGDPRRRGRGRGRNTLCGPSGRGMDRPDRRGLRPGRPGIGGPNARRKPALCGPTIPGPVRDWLDGMLGPGFPRSGLPGDRPRAG